MKRKAPQEQLLEIFTNLPEPEQNNLISYAEFLLSKTAQTYQVTSPMPLEIPRPAEETVVAAIKRLSKTYPMLKKEKMMGPASDLLTTHMMRGQDARLTIDQLEEFYLASYQEHCNRKNPAI